MLSNVFLHRRQQDDAFGGSPTATATPSSTSASPAATTSNPATNGPTSSPLLFFVALGFGVVFTNLWIIVGVKYCFRYNARNRAARLAAEGLGNEADVRMQDMPRPRRRREKKLMSMEDVNTRFPLIKYKTWMASRAEKGLPTAGGITVPSSRPTTAKDDAGRKSENMATSGVAMSEKRDTMERGNTANDTKPVNDEKASLSPHLDDTPLQQVQTSASTDDPHHQSAKNEDDEDDEDHIHTAVAPELLSSPGDVCAICIDVLEDDDDIRGLTCGHAFHAACLDPWLTSRRACCPLCKADYHVPKPRRTETDVDALTPAPEGQREEAPLPAIPVEVARGPRSRPLRSMLSAMRNGRQAGRLSAEESSTSGPQSVPIATTITRTQTLQPSMPTWRREPVTRLSMLFSRNRSPTPVPSNRPADATPAQLEAGNGTRAA